MKCESNQCERDALFMVHWPGQSTRKCDRCTDRAQGLAQVMGFRLTAVSLPKDDTSEAIEATVTIKQTEGGGR